MMVMLFGVIAMNLDIKIIRKIWKLVETSNPHSLLQLSDRELSQKLIKQIENVFALTREDSYALAAYIDSKRLLIRDLAYAKVI